MDDNSKINHIKQYFILTDLQDEISSIHTHCYMAKCKYIHEPNYLFDDEDREKFIMLASSKTALLRRTWRRFIIDRDYEPYMFWNAFIDVYLFGPSLLFNDWWTNVIKNDNELKEMINKTHNPEFVEKIFTGFNWDWLYNELSKLE